ncbi:MAG: hypothetical protein XD60_1714, partial [Acetothermia bacterium 64_32]
RALAGQRRYAIARDLYDVAQLIERWTVDIDSLVKVLPVKLAAKGLPPDSLNIQRLESRREEFRTDWQRNLVHLLSLTVDVDFDSGWNKALEFLTQVAQRMSQTSGTV